MLGIAGIGNSIYYDPYLYGSSANTGSVSALSANTSTGSASASSSANTAAASSNSASAAASTQTADSTSKASSDGKTVVNPGQSEIKQPGRKSSPSECQTCKNRKYQDGSNESNVSFKSAQHIDPASAYSEVSAHEGEHVSNAYNKAREGNGEVVQASVAIHTAICPECGRTYVSGGTTTTQIKYPNESNPYQQSRKSSDAANQLLGMNFSAAV
ncbi:MAG: hypothetical protein KBH85_10245 [Lachnospiraceae bacterium]|jgi:hypothetical protein|nr:hypothetical protein [Lachnospiraceae bacterium]